MLQAKSNKGELITLALLSRSAIKQLRKKETFYCPACNERVIVKAGPKTIPHFAHESKRNCPLHEGGEGHYHEKGKLLLFQWLRNQHHHVQLEPYIPEIQQRPDMLLTIQRKQIAFEFQCSKIPIQQVIDRTIGYERVGIHVIWILGANLFKRSTRNHVQLDSFSTQFIHQFSPDFPLTLFYFCPETFLFTTVQDIYMTTGKQAIVKIHFSNLQQLKILDLFIRRRWNENELFQMWMREKQAFRLRQRNRLYGKELAWHQWLYLKRTNIEYLPSAIYLPVQNQLQMKTQLWDWQSRLCLDILVQLPIGSEITVYDCIRFLRAHFHRKKQYPLIHSTTNPVEQYLQLLTRLAMFKNIAPGRYKKIKQFHFYKHVEDAIHGDLALLEQLVKQ